MVLAANAAPTNAAFPGHRKTELVTKSPAAVPKMPYLPAAAATLVPATAATILVTKPIAPLLQEPELN
jgi:hypothetical protein